MAQNITLMGASYSDVPSVTLPKTGGGIASFTDVTDTTAAASDVASGKYFYTAAGVKTEGTASGGGGSATITDEANATGTTCVITTGSSPEPPSPGGIPLNTELIDFTALSVGYELGSNGQLEPYEWYSVSDYTEIDPSMTFTYIGAQWSNLAFYNSSKTFISSFEINSDGTSIGNSTCTGTLSGNKIPSTAAYVRIPAAVTTPSSSYLSLIRTA